MDFKNLVIGVGCFIVGHFLVWFQLNGQFLWKWFRDNEGLMALVGIPVSLLMIWGTKHIVEGFDGLLWPQRFLAFATGIIIFSICTWVLKGEGINTKTLISLCLATCLVLIQIFWK